MPTYLRTVRHFSPSTASLFVAVQMVGALIGFLIGAHLSDVIGRKLTFMISGIATIVMVVYSWQLAIVVWVAFAPLFLSLRYFQRKLSAAYSVVRRQMGAMLGAVGLEGGGEGIQPPCTIVTRRRLDPARGGLDRDGQGDRHHARLHAPET